MKFYNKLKIINSQLLSKHAILAECNWLLCDLRIKIGYDDYSNYSNHILTVFISVF